MHKPQTVEDVTHLRFDYYVAVDRRSGCWVWRRTVSRTGYGRVGISRRYYQAHRVFYEAFVGPIPSGLHIDHLCRNRRCVNPAHMEPVSCRTNVLRGEGLAAKNAAKEQCPQGHPYSASNTYVKPGKGGARRVCRACLRIEWRLKYQRHAAKIAEQKKLYYARNRDRAIAYARSRRAAKRAERVSS